MIFITILSPILDSVTAVIMTILEVIKGKLSIKVAEYNNQISKIGLDEEKTQVIGFSIPTEQDGYEDD